MVIQLCEYTKHYWLYILGELYHENWISINPLKYLNHFIKIQDFLTFNV